MSRGQMERTRGGQFHRRTLTDTVKCSRRAPPNALLSLGFFTKANRPGSAEPEADLTSPPIVQALSVTHEAQLRLCLSDPAIFEEGPQKGGYEVGFNQHVIIEK